MQSKVRKCVTVDIQNKQYVDSLVREKKAKNFSQVVDNMIEERRLENENEFNNN